MRCHGLFESYEEDTIELELDFADGPHLLLLIGDPRFDTTHRQAPTVRQVPMRILPVVLLASVLLSGGLFACGEDKASSSGGPAAGASAGGTASAGGGSGEGGAAGSTAAAGAAGAGGGGGVAGAGGMGSAGSGSGQAGCGGAAPMSTPECNKYEACVAGACSDISDKCFGPGYKQGSFGGTCKPFYDCAIACGCDSACKTTCGKNMAKDCQDCFTEFGTCSSTTCTADATACSKSAMP